jgi:cellulose synthase operon protein C
MIGTGLIALCILVAGIAGAVLSLPNDSDMAFMRFKDGEYAAAQEGFERAWRAGDVSINTVMPLVAIHDANARPNQAIKVFEHFVETRPTDIAARRMLGTLYRQALRPGDTIRNLETIVQLHPTEADLRELANLHAFAGQTDGQIEALSRLAALTNWSDTETVVPLANLLAGDGRMEEAIGVLNRLDDRQALAPEQQEPARTFLLVLLIETGRPQDAVSRAEQWLGAATIDPAEAIQYAGLLADAQRRDLAARLLVPLRDRPDIGDDVLGHLAGFQLVLKQRDDARQTLKVWRDRGPIASEHQAQFIELALGVDLLDLAVAETANPGNLPDRVLAMLAEVAFFSGRMPVIDRLESQVGDGFLAARPVFAAELSTARNRMDQAGQWADQALADESLAVEDRIRLSHVLVRLGRPGDADRELQKVVAMAPVPPAALDGLATLFLTLERAEQGYRTFAEILEDRNSATTDLHRAAQWGWARLAAASNHGAEVAPLVEQGVLADPIRLQDLFFIASDHRDGSLAATVAQRLFDAKPSDDTRLWLAQALIMANRPGEALEHLRTLVHGGVEVADLHGFAPKPDGNDTEPLDLLRRRATDATLLVEERREAALRLLNADDRTSAEATFRELAAVDGPKGIDTRELLYLWGPQPGTEALDWLEHRARSAATPEERAAWLSHLVAKGGAARAVALIDQPGGEPKGALRDALVVALQRLGRNERLAATVDAALAEERDPARLASYAKAAEAAQRLDTADRAWRAVLAVAPDDPTALRQTGILAAIRGDQVRAVDVLGPLLAVSEGDFDANYRYGNALYALDRGKEARPFLYRALEQLRKLPNQTSYGRRIEAEILDRLGHTGETTSLHSSLPEAGGADAPGAVR